MIDFKPMQWIRLATIVITPVLIVGCASVLNPGGGETSFSCPGMPQGIVCKTPLAVYKSTNRMPDEIESDMPMGTHVTDKGTNSDPIFAQTPAAEPGTAKSDKAPGASPISAVPLTGKPVRLSATVMRIWIAPWTDKNDDLHFPGYQFTEIQPRRWSVGKSARGGQGSVVPFKNPTSHTPELTASGKNVGKAAEGSIQPSPAAPSMPGIPAPADIKLD